LSNRLFIEQDPVMAYIRCEDRQRGAPISIEVDGRPLATCAGETVATALLAAGRPGLRRTASGQPRSLYCGMGVCWECVVTIDDVPNRRACLTPVVAGMRVETGLGGTPEFVGARVAGDAAVADGMRMEVGPEGTPAAEDARVAGDAAAPDGMRMETEPRDDELA
jgi:D-hydroxyproline dehydrogenase subunit gamma